MHTKVVSKRKSDGGGSFTIVDEDATVTVPAGAGFDASIAVCVFIAAKALDFIDAKRDFGQGSGVEHPNRGSTPG